MVFALFPECRVCIHEFYTKEKQNTVFAIGKSIFNRACRVDAGSLMFEFGGGGHMNAGTCQIENSKADKTLEDIISKMRRLEKEAETSALKS